MTDCYSEVLHVGLLTALLYVLDTGIGVFTGLKMTALCLNDATRISPQYLDNLLRSIGAL